MGAPADRHTTTIAAYRSTAETLKQEQREISARLNEEITMPELLLRIVVEWQAYRDERRQQA